MGIALMIIMVVVSVGLTIYEEIKMSFGIKN